LPPVRGLGRLLGTDDVLAVATRDEPDQHAGLGHEGSVADAPAGRVEQVKAVTDVVVIVHGFALDGGPRA
jgi:hypothetical protein